jgi:hypothetical protein
MEVTFDHVIVKDTESDADLAQGDALSGAAGLVPHRLRDPRRRVPLPTRRFEVHRRQLTLDEPAS